MTFLNSLFWSIVQVIADLIEQARRVREEGERELQNMTEDEPAFCDI
jgi:hypothetical protein